MFPQETEHFSPVHKGQMPVLNKDGERGMFGEIYSLQDLVIVPFSIHVE